MRRLLGWNRPDNQQPALPLGAEGRRTSGWVRRMAIVILAIVVIAALLALLPLDEANLDADYTLPLAHHTDRSPDKHSQDVQQ